MFHSSDTAELHTYDKYGRLQLKKIVKRPHKWIKNIAKANRSIGLEYVTRDGIIRRSRSLKPPCGSNCRLKCSARMSAEKRKEIFDAYWRLGDCTLQRQFIITSLERIEPKNRRPKEGSQRSLNYGYILYDNYLLRQNPTRVCKTFFLQTLDVSAMTVKTAIKKFNADDCVLEGERRGGKRK